MDRITEIRGVHIRYIAPICRPDGQPLRGWQDFADKPWKQLTPWKHLEGQRSGGHFHKGQDPSKRPEILLLMDGVWEMRLRFRDGFEQSVTLDATEGLIEVTLPPYVAHWFECTKIGWVIECRTTRFNPDRPDTYPADQLEPQRSTRDRQLQAA